MKGLFSAFGFDCKTEIGFVVVTPFIGGGGGGVGFDTVLIIFCYFESMFVFFEFMFVLTMQKKKNFFPSQLRKC